MLENRVDKLPANPSAKYRELRLALFKELIEERGLDGLLLAHHADDQAETILLRLARGSGIQSLTGMQAEARIDGIRVLRPLLEMRSPDIRSFLRSINQDWREDSSNLSDQYQRNVSRAILAENPELMEMLLKLSQSARSTVQQLEDIAPILNESFFCSELDGLPSVIARHAARKWLINRGAKAVDISPATCDRLINQAIDPLSSLRQHYPGKIWVRRRKKQIDVIQPKSS